MNVPCALGLHKWNGCKCCVCGKLRDEGHMWHGCKCAACSKTRHEWDRCRCSACGEARDVYDALHDWYNCDPSENGDEKCRRCGATATFRYERTALYESTGSGNRTGLFYDRKVRDIKLPK